MALPFIYTNPEAAKQAIADRQLQAALAENSSREAIAREQTQQQRYATQSQISEREKDRAVSREDIASRERYRTGSGTDAATRERSNTQYQTILGEISELDPMTKRELEARIAASPQLTEDLANNLRSTRDQAYKNAKSNFAMGERLANNYRTELDVFKKTPTAAGAADLYKRLNGDKNVLFDRATGSVQSAFPKPREDASVTQSGILGSYKPGGVFPSAQEMQALGTQPATAGSVPTIGQMRARVTGVPVGAPVSISPAQDYGGASPLAAAPVMGSGLYGPPDNNASYDRAYLNQLPAAELYGPPNRRMTDFAVPPMMPFLGNDYQPRVRRSTDFAVPQIMQTLPRLWDLQNIRPEFIPMDDRYYQPLR